MRRMAQIPVIDKSVRMTTTFRGYNHNEIIADGEMFDTKNLTDDLYPVLSMRKKRGITSYDVAGADPVPLTGICGGDKLVYIRGTEVFYNFTKIQGISVSTASTMLPKKIVRMGAFVCIWPDKVYFNTIDNSDKGSMERNFTLSGANISLAMCKADGTNYDMTAITVSSTEPQNPQNLDLWLDQSGDVDVLRQYAASSKEWIEVASTYVKISGTGIGSGVEEYDAVDISGIEAADTETDARAIAQIADLNGSFIVYGSGENYIIVAGLLSKTQAALKTQNVTVNRTVPDLDYICESNNRLWGCKYGEENGKVVNELRASKLGDFRNWKCFMGLSTDSYTASIGTDGPFTGCITQRGYPVFFKENCIHKVSGATPATFQIATTMCRGIQDGSWKSVQVVNETVFYKSRQDIMGYDGSMPMSVSDQLGNVLYSDARAGSRGDKYYISMKKANNEWCLMTYNTKTGTWYREDNLHALGFGTVGDELFAIDEGNNTLVAMEGSVGTLEADPEWKAEFGISGIEYTPNKYGNMTRGDINGSQYLSRFDIRMYMEEDSKAELEIMYDSSGEWVKQGEIRGNRMKMFVVPVVPKRCDHLRFRITGKGEFRIYSICRYMEVGSDA